MRALALVALLSLCAPLEPARAAEANTLPTAAKPTDRLGLKVKSGAPIDIQAAELEVRDGAQADRVVFRGAVRVEQDDLRMTCDWLEATYPNGGAGRPDRIHARGAVKIVQADLQARCSEALYESERCRLLCLHEDGKAELMRGTSVLHGKEIEFDVCKGVLKVRGARIHIPAREGEPAAP